ncbi:MAG: hypothetical protein II043_01270 [Muribaculaceae bacterium]|nr:hypothetical protein [Muribaculaceae bacterium]
MTEEERNKEIEWLMGSIKRSAAGGRGMTFTLLFMSIIIIAFGILSIFFFKDDEGHIISLCIVALGGVFLLSGLISYFSHKIMAHAETPRELLAAHDRMWKIQSAILMVFFVVLAVVTHGVVSKACLILSGVLLVIAGWLAMQHRLRLWVGIFLLLVESVLLYFSGVGLLMGLPLLLVMLSIMKGEKSLFAGKESEGLDEEDEQDFRRLRELVEESESRIETNTNNK